MLLTIQYLEDAPELDQLDESAVVEKLRRAAEIIPITHLLIGWRLPPRLLEACRKEAERCGMRFIRWHPLLTGDGSFQPRQPWQVINLQGQPVRGFHDMPEFTFVCPNHPAVQDGIQQRIASLLDEGLYQGFFLDRIRFPSPAAGPLENLACFCPYCLEKAAAVDLDLAQLQRGLQLLTARPGGRRRLVEALLGGDAGLPELPRFLDFRRQSVTAFIAALARPLRAAGMEIGLDCFSPCLTGMVGQDLAAVSRHADWIKLMSYAHTLGPAGLPFELLGLYDELTRGAGLDESAALACLSQACALRLPATRQGLERQGLSPQALESELRRGVAAMGHAATAAAPVLAGFELVEIEGVAQLNPAQISADLAAVRRSGVAGLSISWDLRHVPLDRLEQVRLEYL